MIEAHGKSDIGRKRQRNEDSFAVDVDALIFVVADGMGGHNAGDVASQTAVRTIESYMVRTHQERELSWPFGIDPKFSFDGNRIRTALKLANHKIWQLADANQEYTGMGTTVVCAVVRDDVAVIASVGDSRAYLVRGNQLAVLTRDDVWLNETWVRKAFTEEQLARLPLKNVLSKAIGSKEDIDFPVQEFQLQDGDILFLCSDGLHGLVSSEDLLTVCRQYSNDLQGLSDTLINLANEAGGKDNITIVVLKYKK
ncbi:MAG TPA: protein phosphatase 2C domain-containing protein [Acidobacteriota bacterium]|nr:protein phosphatase 2C domain-containing protein [Acidobacteriota bacterium]